MNAILPFRPAVPGTQPDNDSPEYGSTHIAINLLARGILTRLYTRAYFQGEALNDADPLLALVDAQRRSTLIAVPENGAWRMDIRLQGERETVFIDI